jgi:hypothetical protein
MFSPRPNPLDPPDSADEVESEAQWLARMERIKLVAPRGPFDLVFAVGASLALWALIALILYLIFF